MEIRKANKYKVTNIIWVIDALSIRDHPQDKRKANNAYRELGDFVKIVEAAQQSVQRIAFGAGVAGVLVGVVVTLIIVFVQIGVR